MPHKDPEVRKAYLKEWNARTYPARRVQILVRQAARISAYPEKRQASIDRYLVAHPEKRKETSRKYRATHYEECREREKAYQAANKDKCAAATRLSQLRNPSLILNSNANRRARIKNAFIEAIDRQVVFARDAGVCGICQTAVAPEGWHLDHIQPLSKGGQHSYDNVQVSHPVCNERKGAKLDETTVLSN